MSVNYDETVIYAFAQRLYAKANTVVISYTLLGLGLGLSTGFIIAGLLGENARGRIPYEALCTVLFGMTAFSIGRSRAFALKLQAQLALCQAKIEANTRAVATVPSS